LREHRIFFMHGDLGPTNILIENGKLAGIVDFGCSGFLPEYWEYTKMKFDFWEYQKYWLSVFHGIFDEEEYEEELKAQREMRQYVNPF
jgi:predicted unusual protein kinase regulating ubiquinone biosynthesis (AarF/ABC1/UbiB family)